ncbi:hypothetical protein DIPPA_17058 [Diplonema papillatum]|nr:hypothetical protein DIPPA_17058 [Diplonema papillatum]
MEASLGLALPTQLDDSHIGAMTVQFSSAVRHEEFEVEQMPAEYYQKMRQYFEVSGQGADEGEIRRMQTVELEKKERVIVQLTQDVEDAKRGGVRACRTAVASLMAQVTANLEAFKITLLAALGVFYSSDELSRAKEAATRVRWFNPEAQEHASNGVGPRMAQIDSMFRYLFEELRLRHAVSRTHYIDHLGTEGVDYKTLWETQRSVLDNLEATTTETTTDRASLLTKLSLTDGKCASLQVDVNKQRKAYLTELLLKNQRIAELEQKLFAFTGNRLIRSRGTPKLLADTDDVPASDEESQESVDEEELAKQRVQEQLDLTRQQIIEKTHQANVLSKEVSAQRVEIADLREALEKQWRLEDIELDNEVSPPVSEKLEDTEGACEASEQGSGAETGALSGSARHSIAKRANSVSSHRSSDDGQADGSNVPDVDKALNFDDEPEYVQKRRVTVDENGDTVQEVRLMARVEEQAALITELHDTIRAQVAETRLLSSAQGRHTSRKVSGEVRNAGQPGAEDLKLEQSRSLALQEEVTELTKEVQRIQQALSDETARCSALEDQLSIANEHIQKLEDQKESLHDARASLKEELGTVIERLQNEVHDLRELPTDQLAACDSRDPNASPLSEPTVRPSEIELKKQNGALRISREHLRMALEDTRSNMTVLRNAQAALIADYRLFKQKHRHCPTADDDPNDSIDAVISGVKGVSGESTLDVLRKLVTDDILVRNLHEDEAAPLDLLVAQELAAGRLPVEYLIHFLTEEQLAALNGLAVDRFLSPDDISDHFLKMSEPLLNYAAESLEVGSERLQQEAHESEVGVGAHSTSQVSAYRRLSNVSNRMPREGTGDGAASTDAQSQGTNSTAPSAMNLHKSRGEDPCEGHEDANSRRTSRALDGITLGPLQQSEKALETEKSQVHNHFDSSEKSQDYKAIQPTTRMGSAATLQIDVQQADLDDEHRSNSETSCAQCPPSEEMVQKTTDPAQTISSKYVKSGPAPSFIRTIRADADNHGQVRASRFAEIPVPQSITNDFVSSMLTMPLNEVETRIPRFGSMLSQLPKDAYQTISQHWGLSPKKGVPERLQETVRTCLSDIATFDAERVSRNARQLSGVNVEHLSSTGIASLKHKLIVAKNLRTPRAAALAATPSDPRHNSETALAGGAYENNDANVVSDDGEDGYPIPKLDLGSNPASVLSGRIEVDTAKSARVRQIVSHDLQGKGDAVEYIDLLELAVLFKLEVDGLIDAHSQYSAYTKALSAHPRLAIDDKQAIGLKAVRRFLLYKFCAYRTLEAFGGMAMAKLKRRKDNIMRENEEHLSKVLEALRHLSITHPKEAKHLLKMARESDRQLASKSSIFEEPLLFQQQQQSMRKFQEPTSSVSGGLKTSCFGDEAFIILNHPSATEASCTSVCRSPRLQSQSVGGSITLKSGASRSSRLTPLGNVIMGTGANVPLWMSKSISHGVKRTATDLSVAGKLKPSSTRPRPATASERTRASGGLKARIPAEIAAR